LNKYEAMFIFRPSLNEEELKKAEAVISDEIQKNKGEIKTVQSLGKKRFAFVIKKQKEGFYHLVNFEATPGSIKLLKDSCRLNEDILRLLILRRDA